MQPVDELLDARGIDFGDVYSRDALRAFSLENRLQCMPYGISPMVIYYNTELVDFAKMRARGLPAPGSDTSDEPPTRWNFEQFNAAAEFATKPRQETRACRSSPACAGSRRSSSPATAASSTTTPTPRRWPSPGTTAAPRWRPRSALLRNAQVTLSPEQLAEKPALDWFKEGKLGMVAGFRELVPELRKVQGLEFDVMPMPVIESSGTIGDITGLCLSADTENVPEAADFLAHALAEPSVTAVARAGYLVPANVAVATSDDFLQPGRLPVNSRIFNTAVRDIYIPPLLTSLDRARGRRAARDRGAGRRRTDPPAGDDRRDHHPDRRGVAGSSSTRSPRHPAPAASQSARAAGPAGPRSAAPRGRRRRRGSPRR